MKLIGLAGSARCGKDTVADFLERDHDYYRAAFADPLKQMLCQLLSMTPDKLNELKDHTLAFLGCTPRALMQTLGTEWGRLAVQPYLDGPTTLWVRLMHEKIDMHKRLGNNLVITDVRFDDEAELIRSMGGFIAHISRPNNPIIGTPEHASEKGVTIVRGRDYIVNNDRDLAWLEGLTTALDELVGLDADD
jgi:hypothetical protein